MNREDRLVWIDMEMSGLDPKTCTILEIAAVVTDANLDVVAEGPSIVVHHGDEVIAAMDEWNTEHHGASGLIDAVRSSAVSMAGAETMTLEFLREHCEPDVTPLCGNSIHNDRAFLIEYMPHVIDFLHYRIVDVSSVKELVRRWYGEHVIPEKRCAHRAIDDIRESIAELRVYRERVFVERVGE